MYDYEWKCYVMICKYVVYMDEYAMLCKFLCLLCMLRIRVMYDVCMVDKVMFMICTLYVCVQCGLVVVLAGRKLIVLSLCCR